MDGRWTFGVPYFRVEGSPGDGSFRLAGELDVSGSTDLIRHVKPAVERGGDVTLDLADLRFIDSSGLHALISIWMALAGRGRLVLPSPRGEVANVLELVRADSLPNVEIKREEASV